MKPEAILSTSTSPITKSAINGSNIIRNIDRLSCRLNKPLVCLTFDDGPDPLYTPMILDILREHKVPASFFVMGEVAQHFPRIIGRIIDEGHVIGNHTFSHCHPWLGSSRYIRQQVSQATHVIKNMTGQSPRWFRPPFGRLRAAMIDQAAQEGMATVLWNCSAIDWGWCGTEAGIARRLNAIKVGDIVLMHDGKRRHNHPEILAKQLPGLLDRLKQQGIELVTLDRVGLIVE